jgi:hypothetical protein
MYKVTFLCWCCAKVLVAKTKNKKQKTKSEIRESNFEAKSGAPIFFGTRPEKARKNHQMGLQLFLQLFSGEGDFVFFLVGTHLQ